MTKFLVEDGPDRKKFRVILDNFEGRNILNIRYWYKDKVSGEFKPTRQGITITASNYLAFKSVISLHDEEVINHLNSGSQINKEIYSNQKAKTDASVLAKEVTSIELVVEPFRPATDMFRVKYEGGFAQVIVNKRHAISKIFDIENTSSETINKIAKILIAFDLSLLSASDIKEASGAVVLEALKQEFGLNIIKYLG